MAERSENNHAVVIEARDYLGYRPGLDLLRFIFAVMVVGQHCTLFGLGDLGGYALGGFLSLSGFLITSILTVEERTLRVVDLSAFYIRRVLRIWPAYFFFLGLYVLVGGGLRSAPVLQYDLTFTRVLLGHDLFKSAPGHFWSISVEELFYLTWPPLFVLFRAKLWRVLLLLGTLAFLVWQQDYVWIRFIPLLTGCLAALVLDQGDPDASYGKGLWMRGVAVALFTGLFFYPGQPPYRLVAGIIGAFLVYTFSGISFLSGIRRICEILGKSTYSMYLAHPLCVKSMKWVLKTMSCNSKGLLFVFSVILSAVVGFASWWLIEQRFLALKKGLISSRWARVVVLICVYGVVAVGVVMFYLK